MERSINGVMFIGLLFVVGCSGASGSVCESDGDCATGEVCHSGACEPSEWHPSRDAGRDAGNDVGELEGRLEAPASVEFDDSNETRPVEVTNVGAGSVDVEAVEIEGEAFRSISVVDGRGQSVDAPVTLAAGESLEIRVQFSADDYGGYDGRLRLETGGSSGATVVDLTGRTEPCLELERGDDVQFGEVEPGETATNYVEVTNCAGEGLPAVEVEAELSDDADGAFEMRTGLQNAELAPGESVLILIALEPGDQTGEIEGQLDVSVVGAEVTETFPLVGSGPRACPTSEIEVRLEESGDTVTGEPVAPRQTVEFEVTGGVPASVSTYNWWVTDRPANSRTELQPGPGDADPELRLDTAGVWRLKVDLVAEERFQHCEPTAVEVEARPQEDIYLELTWRPVNGGQSGEGSGADLDLHYRHPDGTQWGASPYDIYRGNETADWGQQGDVSDDPRLVSERHLGPGPEVITHDDPEPREDYMVGVEFHDGEAGATVYATLRVYVQGVLAASFEERALEKPDFWTVGRIDWPSGDVEAINEVEAR